MTAQKVRVPLNDRAYDIHIGEGLLETAGALLRPLLSRSRIVVVTDENVHRCHGAALNAGLQSAGLTVEFITLKPGEVTKSFNTFESLLCELVNLGVERDDVVIAFGGGVIGDITGFACSVLRRGCKFAQIPTTLLAQVDSSVGGKTAINIPQGKNLVGAFHQPSIVITDVSTLNTLPARELRAGYAEVIKYGLIADALFFNWLENHGAELLSGDVSSRIYAIQKSCEAKASIVASDERERGQRALLNLGHTFGHAFEAAFGYSDQLLHGEGVALGMSLAFDYSVRLGICPKEDALRVKKHLNDCDLPKDIAELNTEFTSSALVKYMLQDKKVEQGKLTLILADHIGSARIVKDAEISDVTNFLKEKTGR